MAQIKMDAEKVKEMCDLAIEFYLSLSSDLNKEEDKLLERVPDHIPEAKLIMMMNRQFGGYFAKEICALRRIKSLTENSGVIWISDSDMELLSKKLKKADLPSNPPLKVTVKAGNSEKKYVVNIEKLKKDIRQETVVPSGFMKYWLERYNNNMIVSFSECKSINEIVGIHKRYFEEIQSITTKLNPEFKDTEEWNDQSDSQEVKGED